MQAIINSNISSCVKHFIEQLEEQNDYDVVILMTRKLYSLYRSYRKTGKSSEQPLIITNEAVPFHREAIKQKRVLVVDDIMIHGRTVNKVSAYLNELDATDVDYRVFALSDDVNEYGLSSFSGFTYRPTNVQKEVQYSVRFDRACWRKLSREIVNRLQNTLTPLRAASCFLHVNIADKSADVQKWILRNFPRVKEIVNRDIEHDDVCMYIASYPIDERIEKLADIVSSVELQFSFLRCHDEQRAILIVPHVFLRATHEEDLQLFWEKLGLLYEDSTNFHVAQYRFLKYYVSYLVTKVISQELIKQNQNSIDVKVDTTDGDYFLPPELINSIYSEEFETVFIESVHSTTWKKYQLNVNRANIMEHLYNKERTFGENIADCGFADELLYRYQKGKRGRRIEGARICYLVEQLGLDYDEIVFSLAHSITTINHLPKSKWITERLLPGEQAYLDMLLSDPRKLIQVKGECEFAQIMHPIDFSDNISEIIKRTMGMSVDNRLKSILNAINAGYGEENLEAELVGEEFKTILVLYFLYLTEMDVSTLYDSLPPNQRN